MANIFWLFTFLAGVIFAWAGELKPGGSAPQTGFYQGYQQQDKNTLLIFWNSGCPECVKEVARLQQVYRSWESRGVTLVTVNNDAVQDTPAVKRFIADHELAFPVLFDPDRKLAAAFGCQDYSFSFFLVGADNRIQALHYNKPDDPQGAISESIQSLSPKETADPQKAPGILLHGEQRIRWQSVGSDSVNIRGVYGDSLVRGRSLMFHMDFYLTYPIKPWLDCGGLVRLSNEGDQVLEGGPQYLSHGIGSPYIHLKLKQAELTAGYYGIHFSPLSLMRWDTEDIPLQGGTIECSACGGGVVQFSSQNLEAQTPELFFEGLEVKGRVSGWFMYTLFYAIPQWPRQIINLASEIPNFRFFREVYGGRAGFKYRLPWVDKELEVQAQAVRSKDDEHLPVPPARPWFLCTAHQANACALDNTVWGGTVSVPIVSLLTINADLSHTRTYPDTRDSLAELTTGNAAVVAAVLEFRKGLDFFCRFSGGYLRLDSAYTAPYNALSYLPNQEGFRATALVQWQALQASIFYKYLKELKPSVYSNRVVTGLVSGWIDYNHAGPVSVGGGYLRTAQQTDGTTQWLGVVTQAVTGQVEYRITKKNKFTLSYKKILYENTLAENDHYQVDLVSLLSNLEF